MLVEGCLHRRSAIPVEIDPHRSLQAIHRQVRQEVPPDGERRRQDPFPRPERLRVVRDLAVQPAQSLSAAEFEEAAKGEIDQAGAAPDRPVLAERVAVVRRQPHAEILGCRCPRLFLSHRKWTRRHEKPSVVSGQ